MRLPARSSETLMSPTITDVDLLGLGTADFDEPLCEAGECGNVADWRAVLRPGCSCIGVLFCVKHREALDSFLSMHRFFVKCLYCRKIHQFVRWDRAR
jgi:hypothetical protein